MTTMSETFEKRLSVKPCYSLAELNEKQIIAACCRIIIDQLTGIPIGQACHVLDETRRILLDMHVVDPDGSRFKSKMHEIEEYVASSD